MKITMLLAAFIAAPSLAQPYCDAHFPLPGCEGARQEQRPRNSLINRQYVDDWQRGIGLWICTYADGQEIRVRSTAQCPAELPN